METKPIIVPHGSFSGGIGDIEVPVLQYKYITERKNMSNDECKQPVEQCEPTRGTATQPSEIHNGHNLNVQKAVNGFVVSVGCKTFVFASLDDLLEAMRLHYENPGKAYKKYVKGP